MDEPGKENDPKKRKPSKKAKDSIEAEIEAGLDEETKQVKAK